jgi:energy-converting hydrogenase Eha subunit F
VADRPADPDDDIPTSRLMTSVRRASSILKATALILAVGSIVGSFISATTDINQFYGAPATDFPWRVTLSNFLQGAIPNLAWSALVFAAAFGLQLGAAPVGRRATPLPAPPDAPRRVVPEVPVDDSIWRP